MNSILKRLPAVLLCMLMSACAGIDLAGVGVDLADPSKSIPTGYASYTLFIATNTQGVAAESATNQKILEERFSDFGDSIGSNNLAVWVGDSSTGKLSISLGKYYLDDFSKWTTRSLEYSDGPYIILSDRHPDQWVSNDAEADKEKTVSIAISFSTTPSIRTIKVLDFIEARIRRDQLDQQAIEMQLLSASMTDWWSEWWEESGASWFREVSLLVVEALVSKG